MEGHYSAEEFIIIIWRHEEYITKSGRMELVCHSVLFSYSWWSSKSCRSSNKLHNFHSLIIWEARGVERGPHTRWNMVISEVFLHVRVWWKSIMAAVWTLMCGRGRHGSCRTTLMNTDTKSFTTVTWVGNLCKQKVDSFDSFMSYCLNTLPLKPHVLRY